MSCCGGKRAQLLSRAKLVQAPAAVAGLRPVTPARERTARVFEYIGATGLTVRGAVTGTAYRFAHTGDRVEVAADDVFAMMAERDVSPAGRA